MDTSQIWRFPKKYAELFKNISNEDIGKIIKGLFLDEIEDLEGLNKAYYDIIKVDLQNLEKSALNGKKGGRPKKETEGYGNKKPVVIENENLKERKRERERKREDKENNNISEFQTYINNNTGSITSKALNIFFKLGYIPSKEETPDTFKKWLIDFKLTPEDTEKALDDFYEYWSYEIEKGKVKKDKNWKLTFKNNPLLKNYGTK